MLNKFKQGFKSGLMIFLGVCVSGLFAYTVSGTIKTWTTGDTLTATDLNTTVQSLKTAVEGASQVGMATVRSNGTGVTAYNMFLGSNRGSTEANVQWTATRAGTVKSVRLVSDDFGTNNCSGNMVITLRKNAADTALTITIPASSVAMITSATTVAFVAGDTLSWKGVCANQVGMQYAGHIYFEF